MKPPLVSIIVAVRNEEEHLTQCLDSLLAQSYTPLEIIIIDGLSDDATPQIIKRYVQKYPQTIRSFVNKERRVAQGRNIGYLHAKGDYVGFIDGHTYAAKNWVETLVRALNNSSETIGGIGSVHYNADKKPFTIATTLVMSNFLGGGGTSYKPGKKLRQVQTTYAILYKKEALWSIQQGEEFYNPYFIKGQDAEMNIRIAKKGYVILQHPKAKTYYYKRATMQGFWNQMVNAGFWRARIMKQHPDTMLHTWTVLAPLLFFTEVMLFFFLGLVDAIFWQIGLLQLALYVIVLGITSARFAVQQKKLYYLRAFTLFLGIHIGYTAGFMKGIFKKDITIYDRVTQ